MDLDSLLCSDRLRLSRLPLLHFLLLCFRSNCQKFFDPNVTDYACRSLIDFSFSYWSLLSKVKKISQMTSIDNWSDYIDKPLNSWANVARAECLQGEPSFMKALRGSDEGSRRSFLRECQGYLLEFLKCLGASSYAKSQLLECRYVVGWWRWIRRGALPRPRSLSSGVRESGWCIAGCCNERV